MPRSLAVWILIAIGCGAPAIAPEAAPVAARVAPEQIPPAPACRIAASSGEALEIAIGAAPFTVSVSEGALELRPTGDPRRLAVHVERPLRFDATARTEDQRLALDGPIELAAGALHASYVSAVPSLEQRERALYAELQLGRGPLAIVAGPVEIACDALSSDSSPPIDLRLAPPAGGELRIARGALAIRAVRIAPLAIDVRPGEPSAFLPVWVIDRSGDAARVVIALGDEARVEGWVALDALRAPTPVEAQRVAFFVNDTSPRIEVPSLGSSAEATLAAPDEYVGAATLAPHSEVTTEPSGPRWAQNAARDLNVEVRWTRGAAPVELLSVEGMSLAPGRAWARREDITIVP